MVTPILVNGRCCPRRANTDRVSVWPVVSGMTAFMQSGNQEAVLSGQRDLQGDPFDYVYSLRNRRDRYNGIAVNVPLMIGVQHKKFYMLAGIKLYAHVFTKTHSYATLNTFGRYEDIPDLCNMPEYQFFTDLSISGGVQTKWNLDIDASFEIGGRLGEVVDAVGFDVPKRKIEYRLAGFVDYGLLDLQTYVYNNTNMVDGVVLNDVMSTDGFAKAVNNLVVGLKFTILFQLPEPGTCVICRDAYKKSTPRYGGRRGMKYEE